MRLIRRSPNTILFLLSSFLMISMTVFNGNEYLAGLSFVWLPSFLLLGSSLLFKKNIINRLNILAVLLGISAAISTHTATIMLSYSTYINLQFCIISYILVSSIILSDDSFKAIIKFYVNFGFIICLILLFNYIFSVGVYEFSEGNIRVTIKYFGISKDVNYLSAFIIPTFAYYLFIGCFTKNKLSLIKAGVVFYAVFIAGSRAAFLAMLLSAMIIILKLIFEKKQNVNKYAVIMLLIISVFFSYFLISKSAIFTRTTDFENYTRNARISIWMHALDGFYMKPILGSGVESGSYYSLLYTRWKTHSCFIDILVGQGVVGIIIIAAMFIEYRKVNKKNKTFLTSMLICFFVPLFFLNGYECATFWVPMMLVRFIYIKCKEHANIVLLLTK